MILCKPKISTYVSLGIVVLILISGLVYLIFDFHGPANYGLIFYLFSCTFLTIALLIVLVKMMAGYKFISVGQEKITLSLPLRAIKKTYSNSEVLVWQEEVVKANKKLFKQLNIVFEDKNSFSISNHEHTDYNALLQYLSKKLPKKRLR